MAKVGFDGNFYVIIRLPGASPNPDDHSLIPLEGASFWRDGDVDRVLVDTGAGYLAGKVPRDLLENAILNSINRQKEAAKAAGHKWVVNRSELYWRGLLLGQRVERNILHGLGRMELNFRLPSHALESRPFHALESRPFLDAKKIPPKYRSYLWKVDERTAALAEIRVATNTKGWFGGYLPKRLEFRKYGVPHDIWLERRYHTLIGKFLKGGHEYNPEDYGFRHKFAPDILDGHIDPEERRLIWEDDPTLGRDVDITVSRCKEGWLGALKTRFGLAVTGGIPGDLKTIFARDLSRVMPSPMNMAVGERSKLWVESPGLARFAELHVARCKSGILGQLGKRLEMAWNGGMPRDVIGFQKTVVQNENSLTHNLS